MFGNFSLTDATVYLIAKGEFSAGQAVFTTLLFSILAGCLYALGLFIAVASGGVSWTVGHPHMFYLLLALIPIQMAVNNLTSVIQGLNRFKAYNWFVMIRAVLFLGAIVLGLWMAADRLTGVAYAIVGSAGAAAILMLVYVMHLVEWRPAISLQYLKRALSFGLRGHASVVVENINLRFDQFVLGALINPTELGWYSIAVSLCEIPQLLPDSIGVILYPRVAGDRARAGALTARACRITILLMLAATAVLLLAGAPFIRLIYGEAFSPAFKPLLFLAPSVVFLSMSKIFSKYIYGIGRPHLSLWPTVASAVVTVGLIFPLVRRHGMVGAAITSTIAYATGALCNLILTVRLSGERMKNFLIPQKGDLQLPTNP
jgi:O-antigen/teichoic acid export membrane protein